MSVLSKLYGLNHNGSTSLPYTCYELGHTWTPYCTEASLSIGSTVLKESLKMYSLLYFLTQIIFVRKFGYQNFNTTFRSIFRSTSFLTFNALSTLSFFCFSRHLVGKFYLPVVSHLPAMISSFLALKIERENRRSALAFYCCNLAMETIIFGHFNVQNNINKFNRNHNIVRKIPNDFMMDKVQDSFLTLMLNLFKLNGDEFKKLFMYSFGVTSIIYLTKLNSTEQRLLKIEQKKEEEATGKKVKTKKEHSDLVCLAFKYLIGEQEFDSSSENSFKDLDKLDNKLIDSQDKKELKSVLSKLFSHSHQTTSNCLSDDNRIECFKSSLSCSFRGLAIGFLSNFTLTLAMHLRSNKFKLKQSIWSLLGHSENFKFGLLLGSFNGFYKLFNCLLHKIEEKKSTWHSVVSSVASIILPKFLFGKLITSPNLNLTQYLFWKSVENWFWYFAKAHQLKKEQIHEKYLKIIDQEMSKRFKKETTNQSELTKSEFKRNEFKNSETKQLIESSTNINLNKDQLKDKINKLTINDTLQLKKLADKLTQLESKQHFSVFNYISPDNLVSLIYSLSVSQLFYVAVMQPLHLRGSYMGWLNRCTDNRLKLLNRNIIDFFGVQSSAGFEPYEPVLDFNFTSKKFQESIQIWTI